jgi:hypothetical protein
MADKAAKRKSKARREKPSVLGTLPATRPERLGRPRSGSAKPAAAKPAPQRPAARRRAGSDAKPAPAPPHGPTAVRPGSPPLETHRPTDAPPPRSVSPPTGTELVTTTIRAAGELAQIGLTVGGQVLKRAVDRLPKR